MPVAVYAGQLTLRELHDHAWWERATFESFADAGRAFLSVSANLIMNRQRAVLCPDRLDVGVACVITVDISSGIPLRIRSAMSSAEVAPGADSGSALALNNELQQSCNTLPDLI